MFLPIHACLLGAAQMGLVALRGCDETGSGGWNQTAAGCKAVAGEMLTEQAKQGKESIF